jgi:hypothetical protein
MRKFAAPQPAKGQTPVEPDAYDSPLSNFIMIESAGQGSSSWSIRESKSKSQRQPPAEAVLRMPFADQGRSPGQLVVQPRRSSVSQPSPRPVTPAKKEVKQRRGDESNCSNAVVGEFLRHHLP